VIPLRDGNRVLLFDGQHKIAGLLWNGRREFVLAGKLGAEFGDDFERYKNLEDGSPKNEMGSMRYLEREQNLTRADRNKRCSRALRSAPA
jgi:hypothetical protein